MKTHPVEMVYNSLTRIVSPYMSFPEKTHNYS